MVTVMWWGWWCCLLRWWCGGNGDGNKWLELRCLHDEGSPPLLNWRTITRSNGNLAIRTSPEEIWFYCPGKMWRNHLRVHGGQESQIVHPKNNLSLFICHSHLGIFSTIISFTYKNTYNLYVPMPHYCLVLLNFLNIVSTCQFWIENPVLICLDKRRERATKIVETENTSFLSSAFVSSSDSTECFRKFHISMFLDHLWLITETSLRCVCFSQSESDWTRIDFPSQETPSYSALTRTTTKKTNKKNMETCISLHKFRN